VLSTTEDVHILAVMADSETLTRPTGWETEPATL